MSSLHLWNVPGALQRNKACVRSKLQAMLACGNLQTFMRAAFSLEPLKSFSNDGTGNFYYIQQDMRGGDVQPRFLQDESTTSMECGVGEVKVSTIGIKSKEVEFPFANTSEFLKLLRYSSHAISYNVDLVTDFNGIVEKFFVSPTLKDTDLSSCLKGEHLRSSARSGDSNKFINFKAKRVTQLCSTAFTGAGAGTGDVCLSRSRALTISFNSATSGDTPEVEALVLTLATMALLRE
ncbi:hypothetical protein Tco_1328664 [Tanacetum coccineum]